MPFVGSALSADGKLLEKRRHPTKKHHQIATGGGREREEREFSGAQELALRYCVAPTSSIDWFFGPMFFFFFFWPQGVGGGGGGGNRGIRSAHAPAVPCH